MIWNEKHIEFVRIRWWAFSILFIACTALIAGCSDPEVEVPKLIKELGHKESSARNKSALKLASFGSEASPAVSALIKLLRDDNRGVQSSAAYALRAIGTKKALKALEAREKKR